MHTTICPLVLDPLGLSLVVLEPGPTGGEDLAYTALPAIQTRIGVRADSKLRGQLTTGRRRFPLPKVLAALPDPPVDAGASSSRRYSRRLPPARILGKLSAQVLASISLYSAYREMELGDAHLSSPGMPDSWTDFFSAGQAEEPLIPAPFLLAQQQHPSRHQQQLVPQLMAPERVSHARESFSMQDLVQSDIMNRIQQAQRRSALLSFKELMQYQRAKKLQVLTTPHDISRAPVPTELITSDGETNRKRRRSQADSPPPSIFPSKPPTILRLATKQVDLEFPFHRPSLAPEPRKRRMPALAEMMTPLMPEMLPVRSSVSDTQAQASAAADQAEGHDPVAHDLVNKKLAGLVEGQAPVSPLKQPPSHPTPLQQR
ncbi:hypothetical protein WJX73_010634 [Symbiochloris irregularis]|uniref:Uncharacterized protein n=1 Tax=Symbiochloris irregularis TaxID=706552 RepID=A0AAW1PAG6_9CHLO